MKPFSLNINGELQTFTRPLVMGILNVTADSFYADSRAFDSEAMRRRIETLLTEGADIIDVGGCSTRPGSKAVSAAQETQKVGEAVRLIRTINNKVLVSVDTFRSEVAREAVAAGANIINDISGGKADSRMFATVAELKVPYVLMHMRGTPETMNSFADYDDVTTEVVAELAGQLHQLSLLGVADVIVDPGFGFAKTLKQNYRLFHDIPYLIDMLERPLLVGISRKSMITRLLGIDASEALPGTDALNALAVAMGASVLRVHDVAAARQVVDVAEHVLNPQC